MKQIYVNGSSLSCGGGLEPNTQAFSIYTESVRKWDNSKHVSYGNQLGVLLGIDVTNESKQGGGLDRLIRKGTKKNTDEVFLHKDCLPIDQVNLEDKKDDQIDLFNNECEGMCGI